MHSQPYRRYYYRSSLRDLEKKTHQKFAYLGCNADVHLDVLYKAVSLLDSKLIFLNLVYEIQLDSHIYGYSLITFWV